MSSARRTWIVATSIGAVEALKDQEVCRWNGILRSFQQYAKNNIRPYTSQAVKHSASSSFVTMSKNMKLSKESHRKIMESNCWGPGVKTRNFRR
ncbi:Wound-responsive family protein [Parasponia andersonii]|uniref:Wound-responsive family protein n=1 Tax=Parasponia andersonii TaxID=3476 RepID=A0A2P5C4F0_PARAD|nr:Wound-responsive family protein [Parasponia andersonii]